MARWTGWRGIAHRIEGRNEAAARLIVLLGGTLLALLAGVALALQLLGVRAGTGDALLAVVAGAAVVLGFVVAPKPTLVVFALLMLFVDTIGRYLGFGFAAVDEIAVPVLLLITAWRTRPWATRRLSAVREAAVATVLVLAVLSSLANGVPLHVWLPGFVLLAKVIAFLYIAAWQDWTPADIRSAAVVVLGLATIVVSLGYIEALDPVAFRRALGLSEVGAPRAGLPSVKSIFVHPMLFGWLGAFAALYLFAGWTVFRRWWMLLGGVLFSIGVVLSGRRRAILGIVAGLAGGFVSQLRGARAPGVLARSWAPVAVAVLAVFVVFSPGIGDLIGLTGREYVDPTLGEPPPIEEPVGAPGLEAQRVLLYRGSVTVAADHFPLGAGLGRYGSWMSRVEYSPLYRELGFDTIWGLRPDYPNFLTDTFWPQILGEVGVFGLIAYIVFVVVVGIELLRAARAFDEPLLRWFCLGTLMVFGHALIETLASSMFHSPPRIYLLFGAVGIALSLWRQSRPTPAGD